MRFQAFSYAFILVLIVVIPAAGSFPLDVIPAPQFQQPQKDQEPVIPPDIERKMAKERSKARYEDMKRDSQKLLELATELKQYVDKSGENVLSMNVIKKCDEIEKLSKSVRSKMRGY